MTINDKLSWDMNMSPFAREDSIIGYGYFEARDDFYTKIRDEEQMKAGLENPTIRLMVPELPSQPRYKVAVQRESPTNYQIYLGSQFDARQRIRLAMGMIKFQIHSEHIPRKVRDYFNATLGQVLARIYSKR